MLHQRDYTLTSSPAFRSPSQVEPIVLRRWCVKFKDWIINLCLCFNYHQMPASHREREVILLSFFIRSFNFDYGCCCPDRPLWWADVRVMDGGSTLLDTTGILACTTHLNHEAFLSDEKTQHSKYVRGSFNAHQFLTMTILSEKQADIFDNKLHWRSLICYES